MNHHCLAEEHLTPVNHQTPPHAGDENYLTRTTTKKTGLHLQSQSAMGGSQTYDTQLPFLSCKLSSGMPDSTRLIYRNQLQGPSPAFLLHITESWILVINFFSSLYAKEVPYMSQQGRFHPPAYPAAV